MYLTPTVLDSFQRVNGKDAGATQSAPAQDSALEDLKAVGDELDGLDKQKRLLAELPDKSAQYVHYSEMDDPDFNISGEDKELTRQFYKGGSDDE